METSNQQTYHLADRLHDMQFEHFSPHVIHMTKMCIEDFIGVAVAGSAKPESVIWSQYYSQKITASQATVFQPGFQKATIEQAAALNAVFGHVMDLDDVHNASITHLAAITVPVAVALGQSLHKSGPEIIEAVVAGYEAGARIGEAINPSSYYYWHTTGIVGAYSAGTVAGKLLGLSTNQLVNCLGSAGTQAAGLWEFLENGTMSKVLHTANANLCGLRSAELAKLGFTGAPAILEGERGFIRAVAPDYDLDCLTNDFGNGYRIEENSFKPYACCRHTHSAGYCIEKILTSRKLNPEEIESIIDDTYGTALQTANNPYPENAYAAKFSLQFCIAAAIIFGDLSDHIFTSEHTNNPQMKSLMKKIKLRVNKQLDDEFRQNPNQWSHRLTIQLTCGEKITKQVDYPVGDFKNPFNLEMADRKFHLMTENRLGSADADKLLEHLHHLDTIKDIHDMFKMEVML